MSSATFDLTALLERDATAVIDEATGALGRSHLPHYDEIGTEERRRRLSVLFDVVLESVRERDLTFVRDYADEIAQQRFAAGVGIAEVQTAFNVFEEVLWLRVVAAAGPDELANAIGLVSTVLGAGKDTLARTYVSLATQRHVPSLDLTALFGGSSV